MTALQHDITPQSKRDPKSWGREAARLWMVDHGFRLRRLRAIGLGHLDPTDHERIAWSLKGHIHGESLRQKRAMPWWNSAGAENRWILVGFRLGELKKIRAKSRRAAFRVV